MDIQRSRKTTGIHFTLTLHTASAFPGSWELPLRHNELKHYEVQSALRPAQDSLLSCVFQRWLNAQIFYHYKVLTFSIGVAINDFYHVIKPEITQMAMTFLYLQYTRGTDTAIWRRSWSNTNPLIERPGINWKCPYTLLSLATSFPVFSRITVLDKSWPFTFLVGNCNLACGALTGTVQFYGQSTSLAASVKLSICLVFTPHSTSLDFHHGPSHLLLNKIRIISEKQSLTLRSVDVAKTMPSLNVLRYEKKTQTQHLWIYAKMCRCLKC